VIDSVLLEINNRFSNTNIDSLRSVLSLSLKSLQFMQVDELKFLYALLKCEVPQLHNEVQVLGTMLEGES
jgi:hypothetical protein